AREIVFLFNGGLALAEVGAQGLRIFLLMFPIISITTVGGMYFQATGKASYSIVLNLLRQVILLIPLVLVLPPFFGLMGIWMAAPVSDCIATMLAGVLLFREMKKLRGNMIGSSEVEKI
ncbi:MAG: efflux family protein, partial [Firmicutes bacterium]|nr:efflux family protein [Bacillota bacterium]